MKPSQPADPQPPTPAKAVHTIGCVGYLNAKPLIHGLENRADAAVQFDVPSGLLARLESGEVDIALCPVIDYYQSGVPLRIVPVGGIGCNGPTLTVRLYSRVPFEAITHVHADTDSHTSVALLRVVLWRCYGVNPRVSSLNVDAATGGITGQVAQAALLIGDKVITDQPPAQAFPHQLDLGEAWHGLTGLPFVFAVWMARDGVDLGDLPAALNAVRVANAACLDEIAAQYAAKHGWPIDLALQYFTRHIRYDMGKPQLEAIERFGELAGKMGLIKKPQPLRIDAASGQNAQVGCAGLTR